MQDPSGPPLEIAVGILRRGGNLLVAKRPEGSHLAGRWEFPGGKIRPRERRQEALRRELEEEIGVAVGHVTLLHRQDHRYDDREVRLWFYLCDEVPPGQEPRAQQGQEIRWVSIEELEELETPEANGRVIELLGDHLGKG